ncbi:MAG: exo-alpha-sialidase [Planctomycetaceae bacterium]|nr:exo-alpha-sialidase [Planctomycetaceae bacterium]
MQEIDRWESFPVLGSSSQLSAEEPLWWALPDGNLVALFRDNRRSGYLYRSFSTDQGRTWSQPVRTNFPDATSKLHGLRLSDGRYVLVSNANPKKRDPLTMAISEDGLVFDRLGILVGGRHVDYPHVLEHEGQLLVAFAGGKQTVEMLRPATTGRTPASRWRRAGPCRPGRHSRPMERPGDTRRRGCGRETASVTTWWEPAGRSGSPGGPPYTPRDTDELIATAMKSLPSARPFELARTRGGLPVRGLHVQEAGQAGAPAIWVQARQHAWESGASWVARGFTEWLISDDEQGVRELRSAVACPSAQRPGSVDIQRHHVPAATFRFCSYGPRLRGKGSLLPSPFTESYVARPMPATASTTFPSVGRTDACHSRHATSRTPPGRSVPRTPPPARIGYSGFRCRWF